MNRYVHRIYLAIRPPAPSRVLSHAAASDRYPHNALDRSVADGIQAIGEIDARVQRFAETFRGWDALSTRRRELFIASEKRKGARKTFTYAIYARSTETKIFRGASERGRGHLATR